MDKPIGDRRSGRFMMHVLWPAFLVATIAEGVFFSLVDPREIDFVVTHLSGNREAAYTLGFFAFWALFSVSSALTLILSRGSGRPPDLRDGMPDAERHRDKALVGR